MRRGCRLSFRRLRTNRRIALVLTMQCCLPGGASVEEKLMAEIKGIAHFSIPVSDVDKSTRFYTEIVGCKFLSALPDKSITFLAAGGVGVLLIKRPAPINKEPLEMSNGVHHAFM